MASITLIPFCWDAKQGNIFSLSHFPVLWALTEFLCHWGKNQFQSPLKHFCCQALLLSSCTSCKLENLRNLQPRAKCGTGGRFSAEAREITSGFCVVFSSSLLPPGRSDREASGQREGRVPPGPEEADCLSAGPAWHRPWQETCEYSCVCPVLPPCCSCRCSSAALPHTRRGEQSSVRPALVKHQLPFPIQHSSTAWEHLSSVRALPVPASCWVLGALVTPS